MNTHTTNTHTVTAPDGTKLTYDIAGSGPVIVLVDGAYCSRAFGPSPKLAALLASHFTVVTYDRRGRGDSGDIRPYAIEREVEDLDTVIEAAGGEAAVLGFSSGAVLALLAATTSTRITEVIAYEPPLMHGQDRVRLPRPELIEELRRQADAGRLSAAAKTYFTRVMGAPAPFFFLTMRFRRDWNAIATAVPSLPHDAEVFLKGNTDTARWLGLISIPVHVISGAKSFAPLRLAATHTAADVPGATHQVLAGQGHDVDVAALAPVVHTSLHR